jgi:hypothetical protein
MGMEGEMRLITSSVRGKARKGVSQREVDKERKVRKKCCGLSSWCVGDACKVWR